MSTKSYRAVGVGLAIALVGAFAYAGSEGFGAAGAAGKTGLSVQEMLAYAIQDEYLARAQYYAIMARFGDDRPFSKIVQAEEHHVELLADLFKKYGHALPLDTAKSLIAAPKDLKTAYEMGVKAETGNITMYDAFLKGTSGQTLPDDVRKVFEELKQASEKHLEAFSRKVARSR